MLELDAVSAGYTGTPVIQDVSMTVDPGETVALIGPNGAGKSTLLKAVCGLLPLYSGTVTCNNNDLTGLPPHRRIRSGIGYVPQEHGTFTRLTVDENLSLSSYAGKAHSRERIYDFFPALADRRSTPVHHLSGGERRMVALARVMMTDPGFVLFDEPSAGLMPKLRERLYSRIHHVNQENGTAFLIVEQNVSLALKHTDRLFLLKEGAVAHAGRTEDLDRENISDLYF